jgi:hydrogenase maturation protease
VSKTAIVGVGNILMGDEGIGVRAIQALEHSALPENVTLIDGGTAFPTLAGELTDFDKLIIVDAVNGGASPGTIYRFQIEELLEGQRPPTASVADGDADTGPISLHDLGIVETLILERFHQDVRRTRHNEVVIVGIEPESVALSIELSPTLEARLPQLVQAVLGEIAQTSGLRHTHCVCAARNGGK